MVVHAHLQESAGRNRQPRRTLRLETQGVTAAGDPAHVLIHNVSATGLLLETHSALDVGAGLEIDLPQAGLIPASVIWQSGHLFGCQFERPITTAVLSAAQLRGAVEPQVAIGRPASAPVDADFGSRLQRLRKESGLSMAQLALRLGVSKPTVWAWEQGKSRPVDSRIVPLASALGISPADLLAGSGDPALRELIAACRDQIAAAVSIAPEKVRIVLEL